MKAIMTADVPGQVEPSGATAPVDPNAHPDDQRHQALTFADAQGWLTFAYVTPGGRARRRYVVQINGLTRKLAADAVLPYVTGLADARGAAHLFRDLEVRS